MAIQVGRANAVVSASDTVGTNIDVAVVDKDGNNFTPTAGAYLCIVYWSGRTEATDTVGGANVRCGWGMATSATSRRGVGGQIEDGAATSNTDKTLYDDAILKTLSTAGAVDGALDFGGEITNGVRFTVDDQFPTNVRFQVFVIDGLSDVGIFNITCPASIGSADHTGAGVDNADLFLFMSAGGTTTSPSVGATLIMQFGAAHTDGQFTSSIHSQNNTANMVAKHYGLDGECIGGLGASGTTIFRAAYTASIADGVTLEWLKVQAGALVFAAALKGVEATVQSALTQTDTTTDIVVTGLGNTCLGGIVVSNGSVESTADASAANARWSIGSFVSTSNRGSHAVWDEDGATSAESATGVEYDSVYQNIATSDTTQGLMGVQSLDSGGATYRNTDADPAQAWSGNILFATPAGGGGTSVTPAIGAAALASIAGRMDFGVITQTDPT